MWLYDLLIGISEEVRVFHSRSVKLVDAVYICSRYVRFPDSEEAILMLYILYPGTGS